MTRYGSDVIVDLLRDAGIDHVAFNPGATFRGIHDSLVHADDGPAIVLCQHEAVSVAVAQGYAKAAGRPMAVLLHNVVGLQNAAMAIYNAWCDRAPMLLLGGTGPKSKAERRPWIDWIHTAAPQAAVVRDYVKWDDEPHDLASVTESFARGLAATRSAPSGPVYLCYDVALQEDEVPAGFAAESLARYPVPSPPAASSGDLAALARGLGAARRPVILAGHAGETPGALEALVALAELLGAAVVDTGARLAFPSAHPLNATGVPGVLDRADVVLALDVEDLRGPLGTRMADGGGLTVFEVGLGSLRLRGWSHDYQALSPSDRHVTAAADLVTVALLDLLRVAPPKSEAVAARTAALSERIGAARDAWRRSAASAEADGAVPRERLVHELGRALDGVDFVLANGTNDRLEHRHWDLRAPRQYLGWHAGGGLGYGVGAAIGAALAAGPEVVTVDVQADGDLLFFPSALWTAAHLSLPVLVVVHNNRQYGNTVEHAAKIARHRGRSDERRYVGAGLADPPANLAALAASFGVWSAGPIADPQTLADRLADALDVVRSGRPALLDVLTPGF
jgi:acetolactate synthase I/II/III large subunit